MKDENKNLDSRSSKRSAISDQAQRELERLSWEFIVKKEDVIKEEEERLKAERKRLEHLKNRLVRDESEFIEKEDKMENRQGEVVNDKALIDWYGEAASDFDSVNEIGRSSGIIFDEEKLKANKVTEWSRAPKIRETKLEIILKKIEAVFVWPLRIIWSLLFKISRLAIEFVVGARGLIYKLVVGLLAFSWQLIMAFGRAFVYIFEYLFAGFSLGITRKLQPATVKANRQLGKKVGVITRTQLKSIGVFALVALLLVLPLQGYLIYKKVAEVKGEVLGASKTGFGYLGEAQQEGQNMNWQLAREKFSLAEAEFAGARESIRRFGILAEAIAKISPDIKTGRQLLFVAKTSAEIGKHLSLAAEVWEKNKVKRNNKSESGKPATIARNDNEAIASEATAVGEKIDWGSAAAEFQMALDETKQIAEVLDKVELKGTQFVNYKAELDKLKSQLPGLLVLLGNTENVFDIMSYLFGVDEPRTIMLVFQNNSELRATGGFPGSYAIIKTNDGKIEEIKVPGGGFYDLKGSLTAAVDAPYPFHLFSPMWQAWNFNWFPDWRESAKKASWFYEKSGGETVDAVIAFTPNVLEKLLALTGEIDMPEYETKVNNENFVRMAQIEVELEYDKEENKPKKFIADLLPKVLDKLLALRSDELMNVWQVLSDSLEEKHILVYLRNDELEKRVLSFGWGGDVVSVPWDYLSVIHTNVAGGKTDRAIEVEIEHRTLVREDGSVIDKVILTKKHNGKIGDVFEGQINQDYIRFYVPRGSRLISADGFDSMPEDREFKVSKKLAPDPDLMRLEKEIALDSKSGTRTTEEFGKTVFGNWMIVSPGEIKTVELEYILPFNLRQGKISKVEKEGRDNWLALLQQYFFGRPNDDAHMINVQPQRENYSLYVQKQSGTDADKLKSYFTAEDCNIIELKTRDGGEEQKNNSFHYEAKLNVDQYYGVTLSCNIL